ncbi:diphthamide biosynthesis protein 3 [Nematocida homosporus]|uniref:diphthamide biosynthesis protein 3 n=1 Tax=Nematocida homosporus TaxID=1912981 RepID=UPI002220F3EC|nr:diphthamide biosynthesis protein 3 [Nematocida homosporus]KAI5186009.1 diphthamide biosynthesis protein 3 [Nematocida homosporus]
MDSSEYFEERDIDEFIYDLERDVYTFPCPCGDYFTITGEELENGEEAARCPSCSLVIRVLH